MQCDYDFPVNIIEYRRIDEIGILQSMDISCEYYLSVKSSETSLVHY
jgi:hypothetical protein